MIILAALPFVNTNRALAAPAVLKAALLKHGIESTALDLNNDVVVRVNSSYNKEKLHKALTQNQFDDEIISEYSHLVKYCANQIISKNPILIGLSLFCDSCKPFCTWVCAELRQRTDAKIVLGGPGLVHSVIWLDNMKSQNLIDDYILGDAELSLVEYVKGNKTYAGVNDSSWRTLPNLDDTAIPDYSDYNFYSYLEPSIPIIDSRGCVQSCEFCDVIEIWKKFQYRSADSIFSEMLGRIKEYNIYKFDFRSSISNGNLKEFTKLMELIASYNANRFESEQISWEGSFIIRSSKNERLWELMSHTNPTLFLGVESLSDRVRKQIGKNFTNTDLDWTLQQIAKYKIKANLLFIAGYPTETKDEWEAAKQWFIDNQHYASVLGEIRVSRIMILPKTTLERKEKEYNIEKTSLFQWHNKTTNITETQAQEHYQTLIELCKSLGFKING